MRQVVYGPRAIEAVFGFGERSQHAYTSVDAVADVIITDTADLWEDRGLDEGALSREPSAHSPPPLAVRPCSQRPSA